MHAWSITGQIRGKNMLATYRFVLERFAGRFGKRKVADITSEKVFSFLASCTEQASQGTRYTWCALLRAFFNHVIDRYQLNLRVEVVSKVILRHKNLSTTQRYLGNVSEAEAMKWIDRIYD